MDHSETKRIPVDSWTQREVQEKAFEAQLKAYILGGPGSKPRTFRFGGVANLLTTLQTVLLECATETGSLDYAYAAHQFATLEKPLDLPYEDRV